ncbi:hypothetical protein B1R32_12923 [Abditibacterium utsteinense]|uniref:Uncharacterized protein n=2 Tax=Abditibacterium utsteinense TaxID=1960156 RepID=A0A2S8SP35_9BACT|nr:hypothetical protein B1R32_12923 [Abditibacterium utsteinense]
MGFYRGPVALTSNEVGFTSPQRSWSLNGDGSLSNSFSNPYPGNPWNLSGAIDAIRFYDATIDSDDTTFKKKTTFNISVSDGASPSSPPVKTSYTVNWHPLTEWESGPRSTVDYWMEVSPESVTKPEGVAPSGEVNAKWRWKTMQLGQVPNPMDYYRDGVTEAIHEIDELVGISGTAEGAVDDSIKSVGDPRTRLFLKLVKKLGKQYAGDLWKQNFQENGQIEDGAHFDPMWDLPSPDNDPLHAPQFVDKNGAKTQKPVVPSDPGQLGGLTPAQYELNLKSKFHLYNPRLLLKMKDELFRGDGYDKHGYTGYDYRGITTYQNQKLVIGDFKENG